MKPNDLRNETVTQLPPCPVSRAFSQWFWWESRLLLAFPQETLVKCQETSEH
jgi:hypothetical protein